MTVKTGAAVFYGTSAGSEVELEGQKLLIIKESELLGVVEA